MRPTFSIIAFTVLSGAGYGLLFLLGVLIAFGNSLAPYEVNGPIDDFNFARPAIQATTDYPAHIVIVVLIFGAVLATIGLVSSVGHLGKPLRAWRALSQWRSSWLSREGIAALATFVPIMALLALLLTQIVPPEWPVRILGVFLATGGAITVYCTANIYSSLRPIAAWHNRFVVPVYLLIGVYSGALWLLALRVPASIPDARWIVVANAVLIAPGCALLKWLYWRDIDRRRSTPTAGDATGLARLGTVRSFEQPHTEENYLTHEMGFVLARKHANRLRAIALTALVLAPIALIPLSWLIGWTWSGLLMLALGMLGVFIERWLFFAEARHAVMAYYAR